MAESIELRSFRTSTAKESDIEEYHEINQEVFRDSTFMSTFPVKTISEQDFFLQHDMKVEKRESKRKKKVKKKDKSSNLMDIISSELASVAVPIRENVVSLVEHGVDQRNSYLERPSRIQKIIRRHSHFDSEWGQSHDTVNLTPTFPRVLENIPTINISIPVEYIKPINYKKFIGEGNTEVKQVAKFLDIEIKDVKFKIHHQFSLEKLLSVKLIDFYKEYDNLKTHLKDLLREIKINRETKNNLKEKLLKINPDKKEDLRFDETVRKYTKSLLDLKEKHLKALKTQKEMVHKIVSLWCDIEMLRERTGHTDTPVVLLATKNSLAEEEYDQEWNEAFNIEFSDMLDRVEYEYVNKYIEYKEVKNTQNLDDSAKRRISKPKLQIDEEALKEEVEAIVNCIVVKDKIDVHLEYDEKIVSQDNKFDKITITNKYYFEFYVDDTFVCESGHFIAKDLTEIDFTDSLSLQILPKNATLSIVLSENDTKASSLKMEIGDIRKSTGNAEFIKKNFVYNNVIEPSIKQIGSGYSIKEIATQNEVRLKSSNMFKGNLNSTCEVNIKLEWNDKLNKNQTEAITNVMEIERKVKRLLHGIDKPSTDELVELIETLYKTDISNNESVLNKLRDLSRTEVGVDDTFPIDENSPEFIRLKLLHLRNKGGMNNVDNKTIPLHASQITTEQLNCLQKSQETDIDVQYFQDKYVDMNPIELQRFIGAKYVQKLNKNMLKNLNEYLLRKTHKDVVRDFKDFSLKTLFSNQNNALANISCSAKQQLLAEASGREQEIRITVLRAFNLPDRSTSIDDQDDDMIAGFKVRPLRPFVRVTYNGAWAQTSAAIGCHPSWSQTLKINARPAPLSTVQINVFDEHKTHLPEDSDEDRTVHYRYSSKWLGGMQIPLHTVLSLGNFRGTFKLSAPPILFGYENLMRSNERNQSIIPALTQLMKKETSYISVHVTTSLSHLGGLHGYNQPIPNSEDDYLIKHVNTFVTEYVNEFPSRNISLTFIDSSGKNKCVTQFLQPIPLPDYENFPKNPKIRSESALSKSSGLSKSSSSKSSGKKKEPERVSYQSGEERESIYSAVSWRNGENQSEKIMNAIGRYVSLIPTYEVGDSHTVTLLGWELLKVVHGSPLDHTILLASYFIYLGIRCWVAIGLGLPRGRSSYVLTKYNNAARRVVMVNDQMKNTGFLSRGDGCAWYVHDAVSGERAELRDVGCPMKTVDFVFDCENIWVNKQSSQDCESVSFDFTRSSDWQPVFDKSVFVMKQPILADTSLYTATADIDSLRGSIENKLREKIHKWRSHSKTIWNSVCIFLKPSTDQNYGFQLVPLLYPVGDFLIKISNRYCSSLLREMLPHWEYWSFNPVEPKPVLSQRMKQLMATYQMFGFPLNIPYVNTKSVISTVKSTGVHSVADSNVEFGLAVEVYGYPNNVLSVWVFFASITRL